MNLLTSIFYFVFAVFTTTVCGQATSDCLEESCLETLHFDSVRLNSKIPLMLDDVELVRFLGQPDSVVTDDWECGNYINGEESVRILYYGKTKFMSSKGISLLYVLNLEDNRFMFDFDGKQLKKGTSKADLKNLFPNALDALNNALQSYNREGQMKVKMAQTPDFGDSSGWMFTFSGQMLKEIELWWSIC